ncbi:TonB-dependent receptor [Ulvibacterium sp.]|uniref:TonB-dependent receptor n=1 Tax=Ulvibacterium sp. TaxID=2665914 RepID=UPI003BAAB929
MKKLPIASGFSFPELKFDLKMKLSVLFLFSSLFVLQANNSYAQRTKISLELQGVTIERLIDEIEKRTEFRFVYKTKDVDTERRVSISVKRERVSKVLDAVFEGTATNYDIADRLIYLMPNINFKKQTNVVPITQDPIEVKGRVMDASGVPLPGASIVEKGTTNGAQSDFDGNFSIEVADENAILTISYLGFLTMDVPVEGKTDLTITMKEDAAGLDEVIVVGYGTQEKVNSAGAVGQVGGDVLQSRPVTDVSQALQGQIPGVTVQPAGGAPGAEATITIRGASSLNTDGALVIVDGVPGNLNNVHPDDVESISVLKDGASASIYGSRAADGVILVTTKKGKKGRVTVSYNGYVSNRTPTIVPEQMAPIDAAIYGNLAFSNADRGTLYPQEVLDAIRNPNVIDVARTFRDHWFTGDFNWVDHFYNNSFQQTHTVQVSGGGERNTFNVSGTWLDQDGYFAAWGPDNFDRHTLRANLTFDLIPEKLVLKTNTSFTNTDRLRSSRQPAVLQSVFQAGRNQPLYDSNGNYARYRFQQNTLQLLEQAGFDEDLTSRFEGRFGLDWNVAKGLTLEGIYGYNVSHLKGTQFNRGYFKYNTDGTIADPNGVPRWFNQPNGVELDNDYSRFQLSQLIARYTAQFGNHKIEALAGISMEEFSFENRTSSRNNISGNELPALNLGDPGTAQNNQYDPEDDDIREIPGEWGLFSQFARLNYNYKDRYILEGTFRRDGSSRFSSENRYGFFPSVLGAWRVINEPFMEKQNVFSDLKLKVSYGETGNQAGIGLYDHIPTINNTGNQIFPNGVQAPRFANVSFASQDRTWETVQSVNYGIELGFFKNQLQAEFNYFIKNNKDMLIDIEVPSIIGVQVPTTNNGELRTEGWEINLVWRDAIESIGLNYNIGFNMFDQTDEIVSLDQESANLVPTNFQNIIPVQGFPTNSIFGYRTNGIYRIQEQFDSGVRFDQREGLGDIEYVDIDGDGQVSNNPSDVEYLGTLNPRYVYGITLGADWNGFDLAVLFQGVGRRSYYLDPNAVGPFRNPWDNWAYAELIDYWTPENVDARFPRPLAQGFNYRTSDFWLQDASYIRLKNLQLGYSFPTAVLEKIGLTRLRLYFSGENLWERTDFLLFDPEVDDFSGRRSYPLNRSYSLGLNFTF